MLKFYTILGIKNVDLPTFWDLERSFNVSWRIKNNPTGKKVCAKSFFYYSNYFFTKKFLNLTKYFCIIFLANRTKSSTFAHVNKTIQQWNNAYYTFSPYFLPLWLSLQCKSHCLCSIIPTSPYQPAIIGMLFATVYRWIWLRQVTSQHCPYWHCLPVYG